MTAITSFHEEYRFLSNFYPTTVMYDGDVYLSVENAYQAAKFVKKEDRLFFYSCTPGEAKRMARKMEIRSDWDKIKFGVMTNLCEWKFTSPALREMLLSTGDVDLIEGNTWGDVYWGVCNGVGENNLGKILMGIRLQLQHP